MADSTLDAIRKKVRRLTRSPSTSQLTTAQLDEYVNTFVLYDFPEHLRLSSLRTVFKFYTEPYLNEYISSNAALELDNFKNKYISIHEPVYIDGKLVPLYQDRSEFYAQYPRSTTRVTVATGDGATVQFDGVLDNVPILYENVLFSTVATDNTSLELSDVVGGDYLENNLLGNGIGTINYVTGVYDLLFNNAPAVGTDIVAHTVPYIPSVPQAVLFYDNIFEVRPIPDQAYTVEMEVYRRPTELLAGGNSPDLEQWWQFISYGAAVKVLQDKLDEEGVRMLMPEFKMQERLVLRKTIVQQSNTRVRTIYTDGIGARGGYGWWNNR